MRRTVLVSVSVFVLFAATHAVAQTAIGGGEDDNLYSLNLATGAMTTLGATGFGDVEALSFQPGTGVLFGVDDDTDALVTCSPTTGACTSVGSLGVDIDDPGLAFTCDGTLYMASEEGGLYTVNPATGAATFVGPYGGGFNAHSLAFSPIASGCSSSMWILDGNVDQPNLGCVNLTTGAVTLIGSLGIEMDGQPAMEFDASGTLWAVEEATGGIIATVNTVTGVATARPYALSGAGLEALAISGVCGAALAEPVPAFDSYRLVLFVTLIAGAALVVLRRIKV